MFDIKENYALSRIIAREGMVLLKNDEQVLPLSPDRKVRLLGEGKLYAGGGGSAFVNCAYILSLKEGLEQKQQEGKLTLCQENEDLSIAVFRRLAREGYDRPLDHSAQTLKEAEAGETMNIKSLTKYKEDGGFALTAEERAFFKGLSTDTALVLNVSDPIDLSFIEEYPRIKAVLLCYLPGMEAGNAIADVLCGDCNPSGKLTDTIARRYEDYPSSAHFDTEAYRTEYQEGIFLGYRHFETFAPEAVLYPFGFGLSYTTFQISAPRLAVKNETLTVTATVTNTGGVPGKEVVQVYSGGPAGMLPRPAKELRGYQKTALLAPGESQEISISFPVAAMAAFDTAQGAYVLEQDDYPVYIGNSVRAAKLCGTYTQEKYSITAQLSCRFSGQPYTGSLPAWTDGEQIERGFSLADVAEKRCSLEEFICQLSADELIHLTMGQPPTFPMGTAGLGNLPKRGIPNPQTADGPAGIRRSVCTTCFPCGTLVACSWDERLQFEMGAAMGYEGVSTGVDILLAPSLNLHRNPRCGRNFEYLSEDPLIAGKTAAALVRGVQSQGMLATVKHFAANNCELHRKENDSVIGERALRELYLKGFEIAIKEGVPAYVMSSYNLINGTHASANPQLLRGILRDEWGYEGAVMSDWWTGVALEKEVLAGNNIKMPFGHTNELVNLAEAYDRGEVSLAILRENAYYVLRSVLRSKRFADRNFGPLHRLGDTTTFSAIDVCGLSTIHVSQQGQEYLYKLNLDMFRQRTFLLYRVDSPAEAVYTLTARLSTNEPKTQIWYETEDGTRLATADCSACTDPDQWYDVQTKIALPAGETTLKVIIANEPDHEYPLIETRPVPKEDVRLKEFTFIKQ